MRTLEELQKIVNPDNHQGGHWTYIPVLYKLEQIINGEKIISEWVQLHELYFDKKGIPVSTTIEPLKIVGEEIEDLKGSLKMMLDACDKGRITKEELDLIINK